ncbi:unnamed protein product [Camellia sinensis]
MVRKETVRSQQEREKREGSKTAFGHFDLEGFQSLFGDFNLVRRRQQSPQPHHRCTCLPPFNQHDHQVWRSYFEPQNSISYGVNSHNKENIREFLNFLQA